MTDTATRRTYLDVLRGVAVLIMIEAHVIDAWTRVVDRGSTAFKESLILGGFGAPLFLFLAGVAVALSAGSKARRTGDARLAVLAVQRRGLEIFLLAFLFRLQSFVLSNGPAWTLLKVDILNIMGPSIVVASALWGLSRHPAVRVTLFAAATVVVVWLTPIVRGAAWPAALPGPLEAYLRPVGALSNFTFLPWAAFLISGSIVGVFLDAARTPEADRRVNAGFVLAGLIVAVAAYKASFLPAFHIRSSFWTTSPSFFFIRLGLMIATVGMVALWQTRPGPNVDLTTGEGRNVDLTPGEGRNADLTPRGAVPRSNPVEFLGRSSLFIYWIHVELVYGLISRPLHRSLPLAAAWGAWAVFSVMMFGVAVLKDLTRRKLLSRRNLRQHLSRTAQTLMF
jgi:uncharacterized membrane protein